MTDTSLISRLESLASRSPNCGPDDAEELRRIVAEAKAARPTFGQDLETAFLWFVQKFGPVKEDQPTKLTPRAQRLLLALLPIMLIGLALFDYFGFVVAGVVLLPVIFLSPWIDRLLDDLGPARRRWSCLACGYDLRGLTNAVLFTEDTPDPPRSGPHTCPECGRHWPWIAPQTAPGRP